MRITKSVVLGSCLLAFSACNELPEPPAELLSQEHHVGDHVNGCRPGFADCDGAKGGGPKCEINLRTDPKHCGACGNVCSFPNASATCVSGACAIGACNAGFANCDGNAANGCEANVASSLAHCGGCGNACAPANATGVCSAGACGIAACNAGWADCDGNPANGCEVNLSDVNNCGACGTVCSAPNGTAACVNGACAVGSCNPGHADCDGNVANGCEVNLGTNPNHCGACNNTCVVANGTPACNAGVCAVSACSNGFGDCDGNAANGCEANLSNDAGNCGTCGNSCTLAGGSGTCQAGACQSGGGCGQGFEDCDFDPSNGCETNVQTNPNHCGSCFTGCSVLNGTGACSNGMCGLGSCNAGFGDCDGFPFNGCETDTTSNASHCGACGNACGGATPVCQNSVCVAN